MFEHPVSSCARPNRGIILDCRSSTRGNYYYYYYYYYYFRPDDQMI